MKNSGDTIGNRTCDLPACSAVPQPTALPRVPLRRVPENKSSPSVVREERQLKN